MVSRAGYKDVNTARTAGAGIGPRIVVGKQLALATSLLPPAVQGRLGNPLLPRQLPQGHIVRRLHLLQDRCPAFFWVCHVIGLSRPPEK